MKNQKWMWCVHLLSILILAGCGGGNSGENTTSQSASTPPQPTIELSGLLPTAPTIGAVLYADASVLRVLRNNAAWTYRGVRNKDISSATVYTNTIKQTSAGAGMQENGNNPGIEGPYSNAGPVFLQNGTISHLTTVTFNFINYEKPENNKSLYLRLPIVELRSPVRVGDQYSNYDKHISDLGWDFDGDKINDGMDIAIWSNVIGEEVLNLVSRPQLRTVKVESIIRSRAFFSSTKQYSPIQETIETLWYAPGIGIVKRQENISGANPTSLRIINTEELISWDGGNEGLGYLPRTPIVGPTNSAFAGIPFQYISDAVAFDAHAVILSSIPNEPSANGVLLTQLDNRGQVVAARAYRPAELFPTSSWFFEPHLVKMGNELRLIAYTSNGIAMLAFDSTGQNRTASPASLLVNSPLSAGDYRASFRASSNGSRLWLSWMPYRAANPDGIYQSDIMLQAFDSAGNSLKEAQIIEAAVSTNAITDLQIAASDSTIIASWTNLATRRYKVFDTSNSLLQADKTLPASSSDCLIVRPVALNPGLALLCSSASSLEAVRAVRLNNAFEMLGTSGTLEKEIFSPAWLSRFNGIDVYTGDNGSFIFSVIQRIKLWPEDEIGSQYIAISEIVASAQAFSNSETRLIARFPKSEMFPRWILPMQGRFLIIGDTQYGAFHSMLVWRNK